MPVNGNMAMFKQGHRAQLLVPETLVENMLFLAVGMRVELNRMVKEGREPRGYAMELRNACAVGVNHVGESMPGVRDLGCVSFVG